MTVTAEATREKLKVVFVYADRPPLCYRRPLVGRTVWKALDELREEAEDGDSFMPDPYRPFKIRRGCKVRDVRGNSCVVLRKDDILIIDP